MAESGIKKDWKAFSRALLLTTTASGFLAGCVATTKSFLSPEAFPETSKSFKDLESRRDLVHARAGCRLVILDANRILHNAGTTFAKIQNGHFNRAHLGEVISRAYDDEKISLSPLDRNSEIEYFQLYGGAHYNPTYAKDKTPACVIISEANTGDGIEVENYSY